MGLMDAVIHATKWQREAKGKGRNKKVIPETVGEGDETRTQGDLPSPFLLHFPFFSFLLLRSVDFVTDSYRTESLIGESTLCSDGSRALAMNLVRRGWRKLASSQYDERWSRTLPWGAPLIHSSAISLSSNSLSFPSLWFLNVLWWGFVELLLQVFSWNCMEDEDGRRRWKTRESALVEENQSQFDWRWRKDGEKCERVKVVRRSCV